MMEGKTIAITRSEEDSEEFVELVSNEKATPIPLPTIELVTKGEKIVDEILESIKQDIDNKKENKYLCYSIDICEF